MIKQCEICKKEFETKKHGSKRKYCFECSPEYPENGTAIFFIRQAIKKELIKYTNINLLRMSVLKNLINMYVNLDII